MKQLIYINNLPGTAAAAPPPLVAVFPPAAAAAAAAFPSTLQVLPKRADWKANSRRELPEVSAFLSPPFSSGLCKGWGYIFNRIFTF